MLSLIFENLAINADGGLGLETMARDFLVRHSYYVLPIMPYLRETLEFLRLNSEGISIDAAIADAKSSFRWRLGLQHAQPIKKIFNWPAPLLGMPNGIRYHSRRLSYHSGPFRVRDAKP